MSRRELGHEAALLAQLPGCALAGLLLLLLGCAGASPAMPDASRLQAAPGLTLPAPSTLARQARYVNADRTLPGATYVEFDLGGPSNVYVNGTSVVFSPGWDWGGVHTLDKVGCAGFAFALYDYADEPTVECDWGFPIANYSDLFIGLARWDADRWDWYAVSSPVLSLPYIAPYVSPTNGVFVVVVLLGLNSAELRSIRVGPQLWDIQTVDGTVDAGGCSGLAIDSAGNPHFAYYDATNQDLRYAYIDGGGTHMEVVDSVGDVGRKCSLALDNEDHPHITYHDTTESDLLYAYHDGSGWIYSAIDYLANDVSQYSSIAIEAPATPHVAYYKSGPQQIRHAYYNGTNWISDLAATAQADGAISLALANGSDPAIAYATPSKMGYAWFDGALWHDEEVATGTVPIHSARSLAFDPGGQACLAFYDSGTTQAYFARREVGSWTVQPIPAASFWGSGCSLGVDSSGIVHVSCYASGGLGYARLEGAEWSFVTMDSGGCWATCLALDGDKPCISYYDNDNSELRFARKQ